MRRIGAAYRNAAPAHLTRGMRMTEAQIPAAGPGAHWSDHDQGWQLLLERRGDQILVLEGGRDRDTLDIAFRVPLDNWKRARTEAISRARR